MKQEYYTENRRRVTEYVENNLTLFFTELNEAIKTSLSLKTYHYEMFNDKIELIEYTYDCGDGCCTNYGTITKVNGVEMECKNQDTETIIYYILKYLGYEVEIETSYE